MMATESGQERMHIDQVPPKAMRIQRLFIYPVKSLRPVEVQRAQITAEGFRFDRQFIVVNAPAEDATGSTGRTSQSHLLRHLTIKTNPQLGLFQPSINADWSELTITHTLSKPVSTVTVPLIPVASFMGSLAASLWEVNIFGTSALGLDMGEGPAGFFTRHLGIRSRLLCMTGSEGREIPGLAYHPRQASALTFDDGKKGRQPQKIRFADAAPFLITTTASEEDARSRLPPSEASQDVLIRFRPNIHVDVGHDAAAYEEDDWNEVIVEESQGAKQDISLRCVSRTPRCLSLNVDLERGVYADRSNQLYGLLARDRRVNKAFPREMPLPMMHFTHEIANL